MEDTALAAELQTSPQKIGDRHLPEEYLLVSDVDDTMLGDAAALAEFCKWFVSLEGRLQIVYASGRFVESIAESIATTKLPRPVAAIGGVGSEMRDYATRKFTPGWRERMAAGWDAAEVEKIFAAQEDLQLQPAEFLSEFKVSYFLHEALPSHLNKLIAQLHDSGIEADYIYSSQRDLDFLPAGVNKGSAARFYADYRGYHPSRVFVSGNSGNDASLFQSGFRGIIVGNAHNDLKAHENDKNYLARRSHAAGVMEGIRYWTRHDGFDW